MTCKWYIVCPLRRLEKEGRISYKWSEKFCKTNQNWKNCKRFQMEGKGEYHPDNMMPSGKIIDL